MANTMRWRFGATSPVELPVAATTVIEIGDLVFRDGWAIKPASAVLSRQNARGLQTSLHDAFAGVAMQQSRLGDMHAVRVAQTGVFEFACPSSVFDVGDRIGGDVHVFHHDVCRLYNQRVRACASGEPEIAIGYCAKRVNPPGTSVLVDIVAANLIASEAREDAEPTREPSESPDGDGARDPEKVEVHAFKLRVEEMRRTTPPNADLSPLLHRVLNLADGVLETVNREMSVRAAANTRETEAAHAPGD